MTIFVTVGTSALTAIVKEARAIPDSKDRKAPAARQRLKLKSDTEAFLKATRNRDDWDDMLRNDLRERVEAEHLRYWAQPDSYRFAVANVTQTSAELSSTFHLIRSKKLAPKQIVLLYSATADGEMGCQINNAVFLAVMAANPAMDRPVVRVVKLPEFNNDLHDLMEPLDRATAEWATSDDVFNFTGGYKGAIPSVTMLAIERGWRLFYQHETLFNTGVLLTPPPKLERRNKTLPAPPPRGFLELIRLAVI